MRQLKLKLYYWWQYTKNCLRIENPFLLQARRLNQVSNKAIQLSNTSERAFIFQEYGDAWLPYLLGIYFTAVNYHKTVQTLALSGFGLNALHIVRSQIEALLIFCHFIELHDNFIEIDKRVTRYLDWLVAKMYVNMVKSSDFHILQALSNYDRYVQLVKENYHKLERKYEENKHGLEDLRNSSSFLHNKPAIAEKYGFKSLYYHIQAECSASIHIADLPDRMKELSTEYWKEFDFNISIDEARWALFLSNMLQVFLIKQFATFFDIHEMISPMLQQAIG